MRTIAVSTVLFDGYPMELAIEEFARAGVTHVEPAFIQGYVTFDEASFSQTEARRLGRLLADDGLGVCSVSAHLDLAQEGASDALTRRLEFAALLGARHLITNAGNARARDRILRTIEAVLPRFSAAGMVLALENPGHGSGDLIGSGREGAALVREIGSPHLQLNYDAGNIFTYTSERVRPEQDLASAIGAAAHIHAKDVLAKGPDWAFTALGDGMIDYAAVWRLLPRDMPVGIELPLRLERPGRGDPRRRPEPLPVAEIRLALRRSLDFLHRLEAGNVSASPPCR